MAGPSVSLPCLEMLIGTQQLWAGGGGGGGKEREAERGGRRWCHKVESSWLRPVVCEFRPWVWWYLWGEACIAISRTLLYFVCRLPHSVRLSGDYEIFALSYE